ncbi:hypothetical protein ACE3MQ_22230 [Paenibacillus lentus]|uniref:hypothetical protein n=1 Tax=Paenibacillus lentus TaxID=1338368 RepID=UPI00365DE887
MEEPHVQARAPLEGHSQPVVPVLEGVFFFSVIVHTWFDGLFFCLEACVFVEVTIYVCCQSLLFFF